ncbi:MAG: hypothetical protein AMXMBFR47_40050 [Planctomycetota bacterium]
MNRSLPGLFERHVEKFALWTAVGLLGAMVALFGVRSPNRVMLGEEVTPAELSGAILEQAAELRGGMSAARPARPDDAASREFFRRIEEMPTLPESTVVATRCGRSIEIEGLDGDDEPGRPIELVRPLPPKSITVSTGRNLVEWGMRTGSGNPNACIGAPPTKEISWISIGGYFDLAAQRSANVKAGHAPERCRAYVAGTQVERRERLAGGEWSEWSLVEGGDIMQRGPMPVAVFDDRDRLLNRDKLDYAWQLIRENQSRLMQPPFYTVAVGSPWALPPLFEPAAEPPPLRESTAIVESGPLPIDTLNRVRNRQVDPAQQRRAAAEQLASAKKAVARDDFATARQLVQAILANEHASRSVRAQAQAIEADLNRRERAPARPERAVASQGSTVTAPSADSEVAVWFHDDTVETGRTYQYRLRVNLWNRYLGRLKAVRDADDAKRVVLEGEWSVPSEPVVAAPSTQFFLAGLKPGTETAIVEVWKWHQGAWLKQYFEAEVGATIGGTREVAVADANATGDKTLVDFTTGAVVLDLRSEELPRVGGPVLPDGSLPAGGKSVVLVYADGTDGQVKERVDAADRSDPVRKALRAAEKKTGRP